MSRAPAGATLGLPTFTDDPLLTRAAFLHDMTLAVPLTAASGLLTRVQGDEDGPKTLDPFGGGGGGAQTPGSMYGGGGGAGGYLPPLH